MIALEALREATIELEYRVEYLFACVEDNENHMSEDDHDIHDNDDGIEDVIYGINVLQERVEFCKD